MDGCVRAGCQGQALAEWWQLCTGCTLPLLDRADGTEQAATDQRAAAGWDAVDWAERIAPHCWGHAVESNPWVASVRCLVFAAVTTGRSQGCPHMSSPSPTPVIVIPRAVDALACPSCAEPVVARHAVDGALCDCCGHASVGVTDRVALVVATSLVIVSQLCAGCWPAASELHSWSASVDQD